VSAPDETRLVCWQETNQTDGSEIKSFWRTAKPLHLLCMKVRELGFVAVVVSEARTTGELALSELNPNQPRPNKPLRPKLPIEFVLLTLADQKVGIGVRCSGVAKQRVGEINTAEQKEEVRGTIVTLAQAGFRVNRLIAFLTKLLTSARKE